MEFCERWVRGWKLKEQMIGAARSAKQCLAEGATQGTSFKNYLKMVGISRGSIEELIEDYKDSARLRNIAVWDKNDPRLGEMVEKVKKVKSDPSHPLNYMIDLTIRTGYLLDKQRKSLEKKFVEEGGYTENLFKRRLNYRRHR